MLSSKCTICDSKKLWFIKKQEAKGILSSLSLKAPLSKVLLLGDILCNCIKWIKLSIIFS